MKSTKAARNTTSQVVSGPPNILQQYVICPAKYRGGADIAVNRLTPYRLQRIYSATFLSAESIARYVSCREVV